LSLNARQLDELQKGGLLAAERTERYGPLAAQNLVDGLRVGAEPVYVAKHDWCSLTEAAKQLKLTLPQLIADIREKKFPRIGKYLPKSGFAYVLVNLGQLGQEDEAISMEAFSTGLGLRTSELATFYRRTELPHRKARGPRGGAQMRLTAAYRQVFL
jgi:hypothetical protein